MKDIVYKEFNKYCEIDEYEKTNRLKYIEEIEYELNEIHGCSMQDYFLLNYEIIKRGKELGGKLTYTSRGSAPCYIINKFLGFTEKEGISTARSLEKIEKGQAVSNMKEFSKGELIKLNQFVKY